MDTQAPIADPWYWLIHATLGYASPLEVAGIMFSLVGLLFSVYLYVQFRLDRRELDRELSESRLIKGAWETIFVGQNKPVYGFGATTVKFSSEQQQQAIFAMLEPLNGDTIRFATEVQPNLLEEKPYKLLRLIIGGNLVSQAVLIYKMLVYLVLCIVGAFAPDPVRQSLQVSSAIGGLLILSVIGAGSYRAVYAANVRRIIQKERG
jgi:hypothetical protein